MSLRVLNVAHPLAPVGPDAPGGAVQVLSLIDAALVRAGHYSTVLASSGTAAGRLVATGGVSGVLSGVAKAHAIVRHRQALEALVANEFFDVIHVHGLDFPEYLPEGNLPLVVTLHLPPDWYAGDLEGLDRAWLTCVSSAQRRACPPTWPIAATIENGVDLSVYRPGMTKGPHAVMLTRICPEKGCHLGIAAARKAGVPLRLAGRVFRYPDHERYFAKAVAPQLGGAAEFIGPLGLADKARFLAEARCLLVPSLAPDTSSLVAMEAMASGTPVIAFAHGALPEIIDHGVTGYLVEDVDEMAEAIGWLDRIDPAQCRAVAEERFSAGRMTSDYLALYERVAGSVAPAEHAWSGVTAEAVVEAG